MTLIDEPLPGVKVFQPFQHEDSRGAFVKTFHEDQMEEYGISFHVREEFFSISQKNVLRGMHFQTPPHAHQKLVFCTHGRVLDVLLDLRSGSSTYGKSVPLELSSKNRHLVFIPQGLAHGFLALEEETCLFYKTDTVYAPKADAGIRWDSFGFEWPLRQAPILSSRDASHLRFDDFKTPF